MGTRSSLEKFGSKSEFSNGEMSNIKDTALHTSQGVEKAFSMNSIAEQCENNGSYRNISSPDASKAVPLQAPKNQRPRSAPGNQSTDNVTQAAQLHAPSLQVNGQHASPEIRRMAVCDANDAAETARRRMRVYQKRF